MVWSLIFTIFISLITLHLAQAGIKKTLLPTKTTCGFQHSDDYFHTANGTLLNQFPWIALIIREDETNKGTQPEYICSGSLISYKYVLATAYCLAGDDTKPTGIRLGEYDLRNATDCIIDNDQSECANDATVTYGIEKIIIHPDYDENNFTLGKGDIGLIRLKQKVAFNDYVRPICLPFSNTKLPQIEDTLITSGWGTRDITVSEHAQIKIKKIVYSQLIANEECARLYKDEKAYTINDGLICSVLNQSSLANVCLGDAGGPVMFTLRHQWYQTAIIAYGKGCNGKYPDIHVNVTGYVDWIKENLER